MDGVMRGWLMMDDAADWTEVEGKSRRSSGCSSFLRTGSSSPKAAHGAGRERIVDSNVACSSPASLSANDFFFITIISQPQGYSTSARSLSCMRARGHGRVIIDDLLLVLLVGPVLP